MPTEFTSENWIVGASGGYGTPSLLSENEAHITRGSYIQSRVHYSAPIYVTAELKADDEECFTMSLFHTQQCTGSHCTAKNAGLSWENGGWGDMLRFFPGDYRETVGGVTSWHVAKLSLDTLGTANFYWNGQLKYTTTYPAASTGPLQFIGGCIGFRVRNLNVASSAEGSSTPWMFDDTTIRTAVAAWLADATAAEATYGHISTWDTSQVTDMSNLFSGASSFNEDIGAWDTSGVTTMYAMFYEASSFNQPLSCWRIDNVKMFWLFVVGATSFDQDLGWCVDDDVSFSEGMGAVWQSACAPTNCGIIQSCSGQYCSSTACCSSTAVADCPATTSEGGGCVQTLAPTLAPGSSSSSGSSGGSGGSGGADVGPIIAGVAAAAVLLLAVGALWFYRRSKGSETEPGGGVDSPPPLVPLKARPEGEATVLSVTPEAEEILPAQPAATKGWFAAAEPEGEVAPEAEDAIAAPEPEPEFEPEPEC